ncbi:hypothetical protein Pst134EB_014429 [Puccinia striiformis f. sp. tritici]|nr:hypothetical protein Pst134EB_014429 [Puccinia striiformis f. sp. tritici]
MAGRTKKRPRMPSAETLDSGKESIDIEEVNQPPHQTQAARGLDDHDDSDDNQSEIEEIDEDDFPPYTKEQQALDEQELEKAHNVYTAQQSQCYAAYNPPYISERRDKNKRRMLAYPCKMCERPIHRPMYDTSPTNLPKHVASCLKKQKDVEDSQKLAALGVSEGARPFSALGEAGHIGIMHPTVVRNLPSRKVVSSEIGRLYTAMQESLIELLHKHTGALYLGLDAWQSPNGFDILGTVIYRLVRTDDGGYKLESMPLDFVRLKGSHTGVHLADTVRVVVEMFGVQNKGEPTWIRCFAHVLNLIAEAILRPFGSHQVTTFENEEYESDDEDLDADDQVKMFSPETESDQYKEDTGPLAAELVEDDEVKLDIKDVEELSNEEEDDVYTSESCRRTLAKFRAIARKLNKSPNSKTLFADICRERGCVKRHSIGRNVRTQWNSTLLQLKSILRCSDAILEWQKDRCLGTLQQYHITDADITLANDLAEILQPFYEITLQVLIKGSAQLADVVVFIDQITSHLSSAISNKQHVYPPR